jgi:tetratricopeptide (TPR) repeat protein
MRSKDWEESVIISYYTAIVHFLYGNISKAERLADQAEFDAAKCGMTVWGAKARFFKGRVIFEQGKYFDAYDVFNSISLSEENEDTLNAWKYRAKAYSGGLLPANIKNDGDGAVFIVEAAYINHEYEKALELADSLLANLPDQSFIFLEQPDWQSGFSQVELLMLPQMDLWFRLLSTFQALALSRRKSDDSSADRAVSIIKHITRDEKFAGEDSNDAFYYFSQYLVLKNVNASEVDLNTVVSIAFKRLQRRASRIDNIETKRAFLSFNRWNEALGEAAKHHKLI